MSTRMRIGIAALLLGLLAFRLLMTAAPDHTFSVLGATRTATPATEAQPAPPGGGISNSFVAPDDATPTAGAYWSQGLWVQQDGSLARTQVRFPPGAFHEVDAAVLAREVATRLGGDGLRYEVRVRGAITPDGTHWAFRPELASEAHVDCTVDVALDYRQATRELTLHVAEGFGGAAPQRYRFCFVLDEQGALRSADG